MKKPPYTEIYDSIENDLQRAIEYLPSSFNDSRIKYLTPHRGTAKALMAEVMLAKGGYPANDPTAYAKAWKMAGEVIDSADIFNYSLMPDFANLWDGRHELNPEGVFAMYYLNGGWPGGRNGWQTDSISSLPMFKNVLKISWFNYISGSTGIKFFNNFPKQYRKDKTYQTYQRSHMLTGGTDTIYFKKIEMNPNWYDMPLKKYCSAVDSFGDCYPGLIGIIYPSATDGFSPYTGHVLYLLRYAHTLLTYAEAKARDGQLDVSAYEAVNKVRRRAYKVNINSPSVYDLKPGLSTVSFIDSVVWERAFEFCGEPGNRWFDLLRTGQAGNMASLVAPYTPYQVPVNANYFYDIPAAEKALEQGLNK